MTTEPEEWDEDPDNPPMFDALHDKWVEVYRDVEPDCVRLTYGSDDWDSIDLPVGEAEGLAKCILITVDTIRRHQRERSDAASGRTDNLPQLSF